MQSDPGMDRACAREVRDLALSAVKELNRALLAARGRCSAVVYERLRRATGMSIGRIQMEVLEPIYALHPELDHINHPESK